MALKLESLSFSPSGEYLAYSSSDGRLKLWETATSVLKQEYTPSSHLSATCSCLAWSPARHRSKSPRKKRKKLHDDDADQPSNPDLIAMGTMSGSILLYNMLEADLHTQLENGHTDVVNDVCWSSSADVLFSCSSDQHIVQWDISKSKIKDKWKADRHSVFSLCLVDQNNLLSASRSIKWWDLIKKEVLKKFTGHATEVFRLLALRFSDTADVEGTYFLSAAQNDRLISAWQMKKESNSNSVASFAAIEEITNLDVSRDQTKNEPVLLTAVSQNGVLHVYEQQLNGKCIKPLQPCVRVALSTEGSNGTRPRPIPILAACVLAGKERRVLIAYGSILRPVFEEIIVKDCKAEEWLIRQDFASSALISIQQSVSKVKQTDRSSGAKILAPGFMAPSGPIEEASLKRKDTKAKQTQLPMEDRLLALNLEEDKDPNFQGRGVPTANNFVHLLLQGLQSKNLELLTNVLCKTDESVISNTVQRLPLNAVVPLLKELHKRLHGRGQGCHSHLKWIKCIIFTHTSYLMTCPDIDDLLGPMSQLLEARTEAFSKLSLIRGKLNLLLSQITIREESALKSEALLTHQESSSSDEEDVDNIDNAVPGFSESEDDWSDEMDTEFVPRFDRSSSGED